VWDVSAEKQRIGEAPPEERFKWRSDRLTVCGSAWLIPNQIHR
jgi:hypothetical protein